MIPLPVVPVIALLEAPEGTVLQGDAVLLVAPVDELTIDYTAGYGGAGDVPIDLRQAVLTLVAYWYEHRDAVTTAPLGFLERLIAELPAGAAVSENRIPPIGTLTERVQLRRRR